MKRFLYDWVCVVREVPPLLMWLLFGNLLLDGVTSNLASPVNSTPQVTTLVLANNFALLMITVFFFICALFAPLRRFYLACTSWLLQLPDLEPIPGPKAVGYCMLVLIIHMVLGMAFIDLVFWGFYLGFVSLAVAITGSPMTVTVPFTSLDFILEDRIVNGVGGVLCLAATLLIAPFLASWFGRLFRQLAANPAFGDLKKPVTAYPGLDLLTDRERETLDLLAHGMSNRQIARELVISEETAKSYVAAVLNKLDVENRTQAAVIAVRYQLEQEMLRHSTVADPDVA